MKLMPKRILATIFGALASAALITHASTPLGGLTIAVTGDGSKLVAGGDTRTLIVLDPETLEVKERHWVEADIIKLAFNGDGSMLAVQDSNDTVRLFGTADWKKKAELPKCIAFTAGGGLIAGHDGNYNGPSVTVYSIDDGAKKSTVSFEKGTKIAALALSQDGGKLAVLTEGVKDESEPEVPYAQLPKDLKGLALDEFKQKNDGKTSQLLIYDAATGNKLSEAKHYYSTDANSTLLFFSGDKLVALNYTNLNATLTPAGDVSLFKLENSLNYGVGLTADQKLILAGGLRKFSLTHSENLVGLTGEIDQLPSWPEYWKGFTGTTGGDALYGATTGYRVFKLTGEGKIVRGEPVR